MRDYMHVPCMAVPSLYMSHARSMHGYSSLCTFRAWLFQSMHVACMLQLTMHGMCWNIDVSGAPFE